MKDAVICMAPVKALNPMFSKSDCAGSDAVWAVRRTEHVEYSSIQVCNPTPHLSAVT